MMAKLKKLENNLVLILLIFLNFQEPHQVNSIQLELTLNYNSLEENLVLIDCLSVI